MMYFAVAADQLGPIANYTLRRVHRRALQDGEVRVALRATAVSYADVLTATGDYQVKPPVPFVPGSEAAGIVSEIGAGVTQIATGDRVTCGGWYGLFAEECVVPASAVNRIPASMDLAEAAVFVGSYATAWHALVDRAKVQPGETVLVLGAGGATGYAAVQVAKCLGARVVASASTAEKRALATAGGADDILDSHAADWREALGAATGRNGLNVVFDPVGGGATEQAFRSLARYGRHLIIGFPGGIASLRTNLPLLKNASLIGVNIRDLEAFETDLAAANKARIFELADEGKLKPVIAQRYPLADFASAMAEIKRGDTAGRIVLTSI